MHRKSQQQGSALRSYHKRRQINGLLFALPAVIFLCVFVFYPVLYNIFLSFTDAKRLSSDDLSFVGLRNYVKLFTINPLRNASGQKLFGQFAPWWGRLLWACYLHWLSAANI